MTITMAKTWWEAAGIDPAGLAPEAVNRPVARLFNGKFTIENARTHEHRTFKVHTQKPDARFAPGARVVSLLIGSDNESSYQGFGFVKTDGIRVWRKKCSTEVGHKSAFEWYAKMLWELATQEDCEWKEKGYVLHTEGHCIRCNRTLTTPESIRRGIGPVCLGIEGKE